MYIDYYCNLLKKMYYVKSFRIRLCYTFLCSDGHLLVFTHSPILIILYENVLNFNLNSMTLLQSNRNFLVTSQWFYAGQQFQTSDRRTSTNFDNFILSTSKTYLSLRICTRNVPNRRPL